MDQTPAHERHNPDLLKMIPADAQRLVEVGCSSGALAREFKKLSPRCDYLGIEIDPAYAELAKRYCDRTLTLNIEEAGEEFWKESADRDCWIFGDVLEHTKDPWALLRRVRAALPAAGAVVACIPNVQHWSIQAKLSIGDFRYEDEGLLDRTHLRWFTKRTIFDLFRQSGFEITQGIPRIFNDPQREKFLPIIEQMAIAVGADPKTAVADALPLQYIVKAIPK